MEKKESLAFCNNCSKKINQKILSSVSVDGHDGEVSWSDTYEVLLCGCGHVTFRKRLWFSEWQDYTPDSCPVYQDTYFPPPLFREKPKWFSELDDTLSNVIEEVYVALQNNIKYLAAVGARTALDIVLVDKVTDKGYFPEKLNALVDKKLITVAEKEMLEAVTETGNAAAHRGFKPDENDLIVVIDIIESIICKLYIQENRELALLNRARDLKAKVPKRKPQLSRKLNP